MHSLCHVTFKKKLFVVVVDLFSANLIDMIKGDFGSDCFARQNEMMQVPLNVCEWFKDYKPLTSGQAEVENAYGYVKTKFEELYNESTPPDHRLDRVFKVYKTTALDENLIKRTFRLVDEVLVRQRLMDAKML
jgi:hypothetical protein